MKLIRQTSLAAIAAALASAAVAQTGSPAGPPADPVAPSAAAPSPSTTDSRSLLSDDIVVTAQKRDQNVQDVGIAITVYNGDQLRALGVTDSTQLATFSPGVHISGNLAGQNTQLTIRGVTQNDFNDIVEAPNATYLDEAYIPIAQGQTFAVFDIERVEILKGPQGTLFGRNATGGLVQYISRQPSLTDTTGYVDLSYGLFDSPSTPGEFHGEAALGGPLTDKIAARAAVSWNKRQPILRNLYPLGAVGGSPGPGAGANLGDDDTLAGRIQLLVKPTDRLSFTIAANGARSRLSTGPYQQKPTIARFNAAGELIDVTDVTPGETRASVAANGSDAGSDLNNDGTFGDSFGRPRPGGDFFGYIDADGADFTTSSDFAFKDSGKVDTYGVGVRGHYDLSDNILLTSISDYKHYKKLLFIDVDAGPGNQAANYAGVNATSASQELRLNGKSADFDWVAGLYYLYIDADSDNGLKFPVGSVVPGAPFDVGSDARLKTNSYSAFGQVEWRFAPRFTVIGGARIIREEKDYVFSQSLYFTQDSRKIHQGTPVPIGPVFAPGPVPFVASTGKTLWAGKLQLEFRPNDDLLIYTGINRGVKAGSFNAQLNGGLPVPASAIPYKAEVLVSVEGGFKYTFPDRNTRFNASAFYYDYSDYQSFLFTGVSGVVINADARTYGIEAQLVTSPIVGLDLSLAGSWFDAKVKDVPLRVGGPISRDVKPTYAPEKQIAAIARYEWDGLGGKLAIGGDAQYSSSYYYNLRNFAADKFGSYIVFNSSVSWRTLDRTWEVAFDVRNITDKRIGIQGFDLASFCGCNEVSYKPPRQFVLRLHRNF